MNVIEFVSRHWKYHGAMEPMALALVHSTAALALYQIFDAIPPVQATPPSTTPADVVFIVVGCILMLVSFFDLLTRSRALGSSFLLPLAILCSTSLSFLFALRVAIALSIPIHPTVLSHALPFLISIVGFNKPLRVARAILHSPLGSTLHPPLRTGPPPAGSPIPILIVNALSSVSPTVTINSLLEITILAIAALLPIGHLRQLCALAALTLAFRYFIISSYFPSFLSVILGSCRLRFLQDLLFITTKLKTSSLHFRIVCPSEPSYLSLFGEKRTSLYNPTYTIESGKPKIITNPPTSDFPPSHLNFFTTFTAFLLINFFPLPLTRYRLTQYTCISNVHRTLADTASPFDHIVLSHSLLLMLYLEVVLSASLVLFQAGVLFGPGRLLLVSDERRPSEVQVKVVINKRK
jgi:hypothetical protein